MEMNQIFLDLGQPQVPETPVKAVEQRSEITLEQRIDDHLEAKRKQRAPSARPLLKVNKAIAQKEQAKPPRPLRKFK